MSILAWLIIGLLAGVTAGYLTNSHNSLLVDMLVGCAGSLVGGVVYTLFAYGNADLTTAFTRFDPLSFLVSLIGAVIILAVAKAFRKNVSY
jgi:uncharacterized membrane protein YeaQ/YmgE (transglycosylase-associated protein family)